MNFSKYARGQVWFIEEINNSVGSEQRKSRPWLIVSGNQNNFNSTILQICPITTREPDHYPFHVSYQKDNRNQIIEVEQTTCVSMTRLESAQYMYSLNQYLMDKVDRALMIQFDIYYKYSKMFNEFNDMIESTLSKFINDFNDGEKVSSEELITFIRKINNQTQNPTEFEKNIWTQEKINQFMIDSENLSLSELAEKYHLKNSYVVSQYKYKFLKLKNNRGTKND